MNTSTFQSPNLNMEYALQRTRTISKRHHEYLMAERRPGMLDRFCAGIQGIGRRLLSRPQPRRDSAATAPCQDAETRSRTAHA